MPNRRSSRATVDVSRSITPYTLFRAAGIRPGEDGVGATGWRWSGTGERNGSINFAIRTSEPEAAHVRLIYRAAGRTVDDRVALQRTPSRFGGWRWWFTCPETFRRVGTLHMPPGAIHFAGRLAWRLAYQSSRNAAEQRAHDHLRKLYVRAGLDYQAALVRPKGMHRATWVRLLADIEAGEERLDAVFWPLPRSVLRFLASRGYTAEAV